ncbi:hypothetical protein D3C80_2158810 [compost metagenome]
MILRQLIKCRGNYLTFYRALHIRYFLGAFINQQYKQFNLGIVSGDAVGNFFQEERFPCFGRCYN